jgi:hypothetical protein
MLLDIRLGWIGLSTSQNLEMMEKRMLEDAWRVPGLL